MPHVVRHIPQNVISARIVQKQLGWSSAIGGQEVESRHVRCMWDWEGTLLDPSVGGGSALSSKIVDF